MHIDLSDLQPGAYATIRDRAPWGLMKKVARYAGREDLSPDEQDTLSAAMLSHMVSDWNVQDEDGRAVPIPSQASQEQIDMVDGRIIVRILNKVRDILAGVNIDPNSGTASSTS